MSTRMCSMRRVAGVAIATAVTAGCAASAQDAPEVHEVSTVSRDQQGLPGTTPIEVSDSSANFQGGPGQGALSPDGRWVVLTRYDAANGSSLWLVPAQGGDPIRLTDSGYEDAYPAWAPSGDRLYFTSSRPSRGTPATYVMSLDVDASSGTPRGVPIQVTLEPNSSDAAPSPDGRFLAYRAGEGGHEIRVVPATGGNSRRLTVTTPGHRVLAWEPDGSAVYFVQRAAGRGPGLYREPVGGGEPSLVLQLERGIVAFHPPTRRIVTRREVQGRVIFELVDFSGRVLWSGEFPGASVDSGVRGVMRFAADGSLLGSNQRTLAAMRVRPTRGGGAIELNGAGEYDWPLSWTADSRRLIVESTEGEQPVVRILSLDGQPPRIIPLPETAYIDWATPTHVSYSVPTVGDRRRLLALDLAAGETTVLAEDLGPRRGPWSWNSFGPGGLYRDLQGFLVGDLVNGRVEIETAQPGAARRVLARLPADTPVRTYAFQGEREAFTQVVGDSVAVMLAEPRGSAPRVLTTIGLARDVGGGGASMAFSFDGSLLAVDAFGDASAGDALVVRVPATGRATDVLRVPVGAEYWYEPRWLPDNSGFTVIAGLGSEAWVAFVPARPGEPVRHLSRDEHNPTWGNEVSPDGRWVAYPAETSWKTTLWKLDVSQLVGRGVQ